MKTPPQQARDLAVALTRVLQVAESATLHKQIDLERMKAAEMNMKTIQVNVVNPNLSDAQFREFVNTFYTYD